MNTPIDSLDELKKAELEMLALGKEIEARLANGDEKGAWQKQIELNTQHEKWRKLLIQFYQNIKNNNP